MHQPLQVNFSKLWHQLHNGSVHKQKANESDFTSSVWEKPCYSGSHAVRLATNHSVGYPQDGTLLADVVCFEVQCLKSLSNLVFTHLSKVDESIYVTYFQQKDMHTK